MRLIDSGWSEELQAAATGLSEIQIVCPFIKAGALKRLLREHPRTIRVITRFNLRDFAQGVSDTQALRICLDAGAEVRGIKALHAKLFLFGSQRAVVTSANLTDSALDRNHELGFISDDPCIVQICRSYFDQLWSRGGSNLTASQLDQWDETVMRHNASGGRPILTMGLGDFGANAGFAEQDSSDVPLNIAAAAHAFIKFQGSGGNRLSQTTPVLDEIVRSGCHWAVSYPRDKRPRSVSDGDVIYIARLVEDPIDIRIFGRAIAMRYVPGRDDASEADIALLPWKVEWPHSIRVHDAQFVSGALANGISMYQIMDDLGERVFATTERNAKIGIGNQNPRKSYLRQASVQLSDTGHRWLAVRLQEAFDRYGTIPQGTIEELDWPIVLTDAKNTPAREITPNTAGDADQSRRQLVADRVLHPKYEGSVAESARDRKWLVTLFERADPVTGAFNPPEPTDLGIVSRLSKLGFLSYSSPRDQFRITEKGLSRARQLSQSSLK